MPADRPLRLLLGAFADAGHAVPMIALGRALRARGHEVVLETGRGWRAHVEAEGLGFALAPEHGVAALGRYEAALRSARATRPLVADLRPDAVVADVLTLGPALAGELQGVPVATLVPHVDPRPAPGLPPYSGGARLPRTPVGRALLAPAGPLVRAGYERGRRELDDVRRRLGLEPQDRALGGISSELCLIGTFPALEYPRAWEPGTHVVGPLLWEPPFGDVDEPAGDEPLVLVAPSTAQDLEHRLLRAAVAGLERLDVRVLATWNRRLPEPPLRVRRGARTVLVEWLSYSRVMPRCAVVVCHGGHGTVARALACGCVPVCVPAEGDMNENAARVDWAGAGVRLPRRLCRPRPLALAVARALGDPRLARRARELAAWVAAADPAGRAAELVEGFARR